MSSTTAGFMVSPNICSVTDRDGTTILDIGRDRIYSVIGVGSLVWKRLASSPGGVTLEAIFEELSAEFREVPRKQIERDVERLLGGFQQKGLLKSEEKASGRFAQAIRDMAGAGITFLSRITITLLLKLRFNGLAAFFGFAMINLALKTFGFRGLCDAVKGWPVSSKATHFGSEQEVCDAVDRATTWYPKQAMCLQRSAMTTCLLREHGIPAQMVIGCRKIPFKAHAWAEVDGRVVNEKKRVHESYKVLNRL